jgi:hypothetical protein
MNGSKNKSSIISDFVIVKVRTTQEVGCIPQMTDRQQTATNSFHVDKQAYKNIHRIAFHAS